MRTRAFVALAFVANATNELARRTYDHQNRTYTPTFDEFRASALDDVRVTAFFSPDTSARAVERAIDGAKERVAAYAPSTESWSGCSPSAACVGCAAAWTRENEAQVFFRALLNAANRGVRVRLLTNAFDDVRECRDGVSMLTYFSQVPRIEVKTYATTTFQHAKVLVVDDCVAVSSVNWSKSSFIENREAGILMCGSAGVVEYATTVFDFDWHLGRSWMPPNALSRSDIALMRNASYLAPFALPKHNITEPHYVPRLVSIGVRGDAVSLNVAPDTASTALYDELSHTHETLDVYTYQITDDVFARFLITLSERVAIRVALSRAIFMDEDRRASTIVVEQIRAESKGRIEFFTSPHFYRYAHLKIWIRDRDTVGLSTGNFSPSDIPSPIHPFPPFGDPAWRAINRDFNVVVRDRTFANEFQRLFDGDREHFERYRAPSKF